MNFNQVFEKYSKLKKKHPDTSHHGQNIRAIELELRAKNPDLQEFEKRKMTIEQGARIAGSLTKLFHDYNEGAAVSPLVVFEYFRSQNIIAIGRSKEDNKNALYLMIKDVYFKKEDAQKAFIKWFDNLYTKLEGFLEEFEMRSQQDMLNYITANEQYQAKQAAKKKGSKK